MRMEKSWLHFFEKVAVCKKLKTLRLTLIIRTSRWLKTIKKIKMLHIPRFLDA